jgi:sucrose PTS system EIIBCA or EIIBC component
MDYKKMAQCIVDSVGGIDNIKNFEHCATRLRIVLKDDSLLNKSSVDAIENLSGYFFQTGQHQFILGTGKVNMVHEELSKLTGGKSDDSSSFKEDAYKNLNPLQKSVRILADILLPLIPALVTTGLLMGIRGFLLSLNVPFSENFLLLFGMLTDTAFAFLPVLIAYSATKKFGGNPILGIVVGLMMVAPQLPNAWAVAHGDAYPLIINLFGINFPLVGYQGSVLPAIFAGWFIAYLERNLRKFVPPIVDLIVTPFLTITVSIFVMLFIMGPLIGGIETLVIGSVIIMLGLPLGIGYIIFGAFQQVIVITGLHHALGVIELGLLNETGVNPIQPLTTASMAGQFGAALAVSSLYKNNIKRSNAISASVPALFGITEPLIFGVNLQYSKAFLAGMVGGAIGGFLTYILNVAPAGMGITFIPGLLLYSSSLWELTSYIIVILSALIPAFILTKMFVKIEE